MTPLLQRGRQPSSHPRCLQARAQYARRTASSSSLQPTSVLDIARSRAQKDASRFSFHSSGAHISRVLDRQGVKIATGRFNSACAAAIFPVFTIFPSPLAMLTPIFSSPFG
jgi:hypothetical protein